MPPAEQSRAGRGPVLSRDNNPGGQTAFTTNPMTAAEPSLPEIDPVQVRAVRSGCFHVKPGHSFDTNAVCRVVTPPIC